MSIEQPAPPADGPVRDRGPHEDIIRNQLARVLASPEFAGRSVLRAFLAFVVEKQLAGLHHEIKEFTVATEVFGRKQTFDGRMDSIVRIQAGRLRQALERYYQSNGSNDPVRIKIPKGSYVPTFYKLSSDQHDCIEPRPKPAEPPSPLPHGPSVAVMPLINLTGSPSQEYFTDGLTEELTHGLAQFQYLRVIASHSTLQLKGVKASVGEIGQRLGARFLIDGSVRRDAERIKITARLIDTRSGIQVWGEQYGGEFKAENLIALQENIARRVAGKIGDLFGVISAQMSKESQKKPIDSLDTYDALLRFHHYHTLLSPEAFAEAFRASEHAVAKDPGSGLAWSLLANLYAGNYTFGHSPVSTPFEEAVAMARKGVSLEPGNQWVHTIYAHLLFLQNERDSFFREAESSLALNPNNPSIVAIIGWLMALYGDWERGLALLQKGIELNPFCPGWHHAAPYFEFYRQGKYLEAFHVAQLLNMPQLFWDPLLQAAALGQMGKGLEAAEQIRRLLSLRPDFPACGSWLLGLYVKSPALVEATLDGLRKAGLMV